MSYFSKDQITNFKNSAYGSSILHYYVVSLLSLTVLISVVWRTQCCFEFLYSICKQKYLEKLGNRLSQQ